MNHPDHKEEDFRTAAAAKSTRLVKAFEAERGRPVDDPVEAGVSYCLPVEGLGRDIMRRLKIVSTLFWVVGMAGLLTAVAIGIPWNKSVDDMSTMRFVIAIVFFAIGMGSLFGGTVFQRRYIRRSIRERIGDFWQTGMPKPIDIGIEDQRTFTKLKLVPEDIAAAICYTDRRCVQIEGVCYRYLIYGHDVTHVEQVTIPQGQAVTVEYSIGDVSLGLALVPANLTAELKRQTVGGKSALMKSIQETLTPVSDDVIAQTQRPDD